MSDRKEELLSLCKKGKTEVLQLVEEILFIEEQLQEIKKLPFHKVHPNDNLRQKLLPAGRLYKDLLQQYNQCLKVFAGLTGNDEEGKESPLRKWANARNVNTKQENMDAG